MSSATSSPREFQVFISHAGEDKETIAIPLREMLDEKGIKAFVDERDIQPGEDAIEEMTSAMDETDIAVLVLSPEFVAKKWPMKELLFFLKRREDTRRNGEATPKILPVFYRLSVADLYKEPLLQRKCTDGTNLFWKHGFYERQSNGDPEADENVIKNAMRAVHRFQGIENIYHASNETSSLPARLLLLKAIVARVSEITGQHIPLRASPRTVDELQHYFPAEALQKIVLNFVRVDEDGSPVIDDGRVTHRNLTIDAKHGVYSEELEGELAGDRRRWDFVNAFHRFRRRRTVPR